MNHTYKALAVGLLLGLPAVLSTAQARDREPIEETRPLDPKGQLTVINIAGDIHIEVWDREEVHVVAEPGRAFEKLEITGDRQALRIEVKVPEKERNVDGTDLLLKVPHNIKLFVDAVSGDILATQLRGDLDLRTVSGDVTLSVASTKISAHTVSGDVELSAPSSDTDLGSVSGDLKVRGVRGKLVLESVSGSIDADVEAASSVEAQSVSGDVRLATRLTPGARLSAETLSGTVLVVLPANSSAQVHMKTFSGDLDNRIGERPRDRTAKRHHFTLGGGSANVDLSSFSGDVRVRSD